MRLLMTQRRLLHPAGSELFTAEVAIELQRRGHEVAVYSPRIGSIAQMMFAHGVHVKPRLGDLPWQPDLIHGQHHLQAMAALSAFPEVPAIYYCHSAEIWVEQIPLHRRIRRYVMMCEWLVKTSMTEHGLAPERVTFIPNFVNVGRFSTVREAPRRLRRALLFGSTPLPPKEVARLGAACRALGLSLDKIGYGYGDLRPRPESFLPDYDLVFALGRSAIEALATGCAVIPVVPGLAGELITPENFDRYAFSNFSPRYYTSGKRISVSWLREELSHHSPERVRDVCERVRAERTLARAVDSLEAIYAEARVEPPQGHGSGEADFLPYLEKLAMEADEIWTQLHQHVSKDAMAPAWRRGLVRVARRIARAIE